MRTKWSRTYIVHKKRKIYLNDTLWELNGKLRTNDISVILKVSGLFVEYKEKTFLIKNIVDYGKA